MTKQAQKKEAKDREPTAKKPRESWNTGDGTAKFKQKQHIQSQSNTTHFRKPIQTKYPCTESSNILP